MPRNKKVKKSQQEDSKEKQLQQSSQNLQLNRSNNPRQEKSINNSENPSVLGEGPLINPPSSKLIFPPYGGGHFPPFPMMQMGGMGAMGAMGAMGGMGGIPFMGMKGGFRNPYMPMSMKPVGIPQGEDDHRHEKGENNTKRFQGNSFGGYPTPFGIKNSKKIIKDKGGLGIGSSLKKKEINRKSMEDFCVFKNSGSIPAVCKIFLNTQVSLKYAEPNLYFNISKKLLEDLEKKCKENKLSSTAKSIGRFLANVQELQKKEKENKESRKKNKNEGNKNEESNEPALSEFDIISYLHKVLLYFCF